MRLIRPCVNSERSPELRYAQIDLFFRLHRVSVLSHQSQSPNSPAMHAPVVPVRIRARELCSTFTRTNSIWTRRIIFEVLMRNLHFNPLVSYLMERGKGSIFLSYLDMDWRCGMNMNRIEGPGSGLL